jgi:hypothetical protein
LADFFGEFPGSTAEHRWSMYSSWWVSLHIIDHYLVGGWPPPLKNMSSSVGMMTFPIYGKHVPNHQPVNHYYLISRVDIANNFWIRSPILLRKNYI